MLAIALMLEGWSREAAAEACAMADFARLGASLQRGRTGRAVQPAEAQRPTPRLSAEQLAKIAEWVEQGPDFDRHGVVRWRCVDLQQQIREEFPVELHESTVGKLLAAAR